MVVAMDHDFCVAYLGSTRLENAGSVIGVVAPDGSNIINFWDVRDYREPGHSPELALAIRLGEFTRRDALAPVWWFEVVKITLGDWDAAVVVILQLSLAVIIQQPVKELLIAGPNLEVSISQMISTYTM